MKNNQFNFFNFEAHHFHVEYIVIYQLKEK